MKKIILAAAVAVLTVPIQAADILPSTTTTTTIPEGTEFQSTTTTTTTSGIPKSETEQKMEETPTSQIAPPTPVPKESVEPVEPQKMENSESEESEEGEEENEEDEFFPSSSLQDIDEEEDYL